MRITRMGNFAYAFLDYNLSISNVCNMLKPDMIRCKYFDYCFDYKLKSNIQDLTLFTEVYRKVAKRYVKGCNTGNFDYFHECINRYGVDKVIELFDIEEKEANKLRLGYELLK